MGQPMQAERTQELARLVKKIRACTYCEKSLPGPPRPVVQAHSRARIAIIGQAPGTHVDRTGIPWNDASGKRLREWLGVESSELYDETLFAIVPMGFCYPGKGRQGDLPPRPECAPRWHEQLLRRLPEMRVTLLIGSYAQSHYLGDDMRETLTETVRHWQSFLPRFIPLPHPSPRNNIWLRKNPWFEAECLPSIRRRLRAAMKPRSKQCRGAQRRHRSSTLTQVSFQPGSPP